MHKKLSHIHVPQYILSRPYIGNLIDSSVEIDDPSAHFGL